MRRSVDERDSALETLGIGVATIKRNGLVETITRLRPHNPSSSSARMVMGRQ